MNVLVACEESQAVTKELRRLGHNAFSCDLQECSGGHPEWHIRGDALKLINPSWVHFYSDEPARRGIEFLTDSGKLTFIPGRWDMIIAHPPCTYLTNGGAVRMFRKEKKEFAPYGTFRMVNVERLKLGMQARDFFMSFANADCDRIAIENPVGIMSKTYRKPNQIIQPYQFGHNARKGTCLWLKGLPELQPTNIVDQGEIKPGGYSVGAGAGICGIRTEHFLLRS